MTTIEFLSFLRSRAINLWVEGEQLRYGAPQGALTPALRAELGARKAELIAFLRQAGPDANVSPIRPALRSGPLPLSFAQQRLWFFEQLVPGSATYMVTTHVRLAGALDLAALQASFSALVRRHETLRTIFSVVDGQPTQIIAPATPLRPALLDLQALALSERDRLAQRLTAADLRQPFDLAHGPLVRVTLLRLDAREHLLLITMHHIISDGWSVGVLIRDLMALYAATSGGQPASLPALPIQYADYAIWQQTWLQGDVLAAQLAYWTRQLADAPPVLELPCDRPRPPVQTFCGARQQLVMPAALLAGLHTFNQREGMTLFMALLAIFQLVLARYCGQTDLIVGTPIAGRTQPSTEGLIGLFINTLVLRTDLRGNPTFLALLQRVRAVCLAAYAHQDLPFERLVDLLQPVRDLRHPPLFQVMFVLQNAPVPALEVRGLTLRPVPIEVQSTNFDLTLSFSDGVDGLVASWEYNTDLFDAATIRRMAEYFELLLAEVVADPARRLTDLPTLTAIERAQLREWNATQAAYPHHTTIHSLVAAQAARMPDAVAVAGTDQHLSYHALNTRANQLAHHLRAQGVGPETRVGVCLERVPELVIALLGVLKAGGAYLPLDPTYPAERLAFMLEDSRAAVLLVATKDEGRRTKDDLGKTDTTIVNRKLSIVNLITDWPQIARWPTADPSEQTTPANLAYVIYTSGSTGQPKGVAIQHASVINLVNWHQRCYDLARTDRATLVAGLAFDATVWELWPYLTIGASIQLPTDTLRTTPAQLRDWLVAQAVTIGFLPTPLAERVLTLDWPDRVALRAMLTGGDTLQRYPPPQLPFALVNHYGPTEHTVVATAGMVAAREQAAVLPEIGRPITNTQLYLLDAHLQPVPIGAVGEVYLGGVQLARGYLGRPDLTAERFVPNPFAGDTETRRHGDKEAPQSAICNLQSAIGTRLYKTGDRARYRPDGNIAFLGRRDGQIKLRGYRIELGEIAAVLAQHTAVRESVVLIREDAPGEARLVAYVVTTNDDRTDTIYRVPTTDDRTETIYRVPTTDDRTDTIYRVPTTDDLTNSSIVHRPSSIVGDLRAFLATRLPDYMIPSAFVLLDTFPLTPNGKLDRNALPAPTAHSALDDPLIAPRTPTEEVIAGIWAEVLGVPQIGVDDNFFARGGHSLLATQVVARIRDAFQLELPLRSLFEAPTVASLAAQLEQHRSANIGLSAPPIQPAARTGPLPLSFAQRRLWFLDQLAPGAATYNIPTPVRLTGALDVMALHASFTAIIRRHENLRTTFRVVDGQPTQVIAAPTPLSLAQLDLRALPATEREAAAQRAVLTEAHIPFDLARGPLVRVTLLRLDDQEHLVLMTLHHIIADGWSIGVLIRELVTFYAATTGGQPVALPTLPIQYADYAIWQQAWLQGEVLDTQLAYWTRQLADAPSVLELPLDHPRPPSQTFRGAQQQLIVPAPLLLALQAFSRRAGVTLFMTLLAAFQVVLARVSGQDDIVVGSPIANRTQRATEALIGFFVNTLVLRTDLAGNPTFRTLLERVRAVCLGAYAHQDLPFERLVDVLQPVRDLSRHPLFQAMFVLQNAPLPALDVPELSLRPVSVDTQTAKFDMTLSVNESAAGLVVGWEYNTDLFDTTTIRRLCGHFRLLLAEVAADPTRRLADLPLLTPAERSQLREWNATAAAAPAPRTLHAWVAAQAARTPDAVAVALADAQLTYRALEAHANQLAHYLRARGIRPELPVGLCMERSLDLAIGLLGILKAGGVLVPLDPRYPAERLAFMCADAQVSVLVTDQSIDDLRLTIDDLGESETLIVNLDADWPIIAQAPTSAPPYVTQPEQLLYVIYTSGSTGRPKGIAMPHRALLNLMWWQAHTTSRPGPQTTLQFAPLSFDASIQEIMLTWGTGGTLVLIAEALRQEPAALLHLLAAHRVTRLFLPFVALQQLATVARGGASGTTLREIITAGEQLQISAAIAAWLSALPDCTLENQYGPSESHVVTAERLGRDRGAWPLLPPIGRPIANTQAYVLDRALQPVPIGVAGELYLGGAMLARGYLGRPDLTAERFVPNPFAEVSGVGYRVLGAEPSDTRYPTPDTRLYKTGDLARYQADGRIAFLGRIDGQVKLRGYRIEPGEIEAVLRQYRAVREAVVLVRAESPGDKRLVAYVVTAKDEGRKTKDEERDSSFVQELRAFVQERLPEYMLPSHFILLDTLPLTPSGKLDRRALPAPAAQRSLAEPLIAPRTPLEDLLAGIWAEVLGVAQVGMHDNFFALGGHSLLATQVIARIRDAFAIELPLRTLFEAPTIADLATQLERSRSSDTGLAAPPLWPALRAGPLPLSFAQQRLWFLDQLDPGSAAYNLPTPMRLTGALDLAALHASFTAIIRRHEALRTTFHVVDGQPTQVIAPPAALPLPLLDLRALPLAEREVAAQRAVLVEARIPFDLARGPLVRTTLLQLDDQTHIVLVTMHHIVSDGWSVGVLIRELVALYAAYASGQVAPLPELPIQYADYAIWQQQSLQGAVLDAQLAYWTRQLADAPSALDLPLDHPRPPTQTFRGTQHQLVLPAPLLLALQALSRREGVTLFMTLLAAFQVVLARESGQQDVLVGSPIANRTQRATEALIGFFVNTLVLRTDLRGNPSFLALLGRVRAVCLAAYAHQDLPFEQLVDALQPVRDLSRHPLFQVMFVLQNAPVSALKLLGLTLQPVSVETQTAKFDLLLSVNESAAGLVAIWEYNTDLFDAATITRLAGHVQTLLAGVVADPARPLAQLPLLSAAERHQLLLEWNATAAVYPQDQCAHQLFEAQAARTPDAVALVFETARLTYQALNARANQLAHYLRAQGVGPETLVALCVARSPALLIGLLGILKAGGAYLPLDPIYPDDRLAFMLEDSRAAVLLTQTSIDQASTGRIYPAPTPGDAAMTDHIIPNRQSKIVNVSADWPTIAQQPVSAPASGVGAANVAYVLYTSGSTGRPKGVLIPHQGLVNYLHWSRQAYAALGGSGAPLHSSIGFDLTITSLFVPLLSGQAVVLLAEEAGAEALSVALRAARDFSLVKLTPTHLTLLSQLLPPDAAAGRTRALIIGGEALQAEHIRFWQEHAPATRLLNEYGPTETVVGCAVYEIASERGAPGVIAIGRPMANTQLYLLDHSMQLVPIGVVGEVYIGGVQLARGYLGRPDLTAERFVPNPFAEVSGIGYRVVGTEPSDTRYPIPDTRLYKTGDLARYLPDGNIDFQGRIDHQVKLRGYRIELGEIEALLAAQPGVRACAVVVHEDPAGERRLVAYVVTTNGDRTDTIYRVPTSDNLRAFLATRLPDYMIPSAFVFLDTFPLTANGKLDRNALPAPNHADATQATAYVAPRDHMELQLVSLWEELLDVARVGVYDSFFARGGHSLLVVRLLARIEQQFGQRLPLAALFQNPTVAQLAQLLRGQTRARVYTPLVGLQPAGTQRPFFCVHPGAGTVLCYLDLAHSLGTAQPFYGLQAAGLEGEQTPLRTMAAMAAAYLAAVRSVQPNGPYLLGGWSFGGVVAFEMAQQLRAQGQEIALLALIDSWAPMAGLTDWHTSQIGALRAVIDGSLSALDGLPEGADVELLAGFAHDLGRLVGYPLRVSPAALRGISPDKRLGYVLEQAKAADILPPDIDEEQIRRALAVFASNTQALAYYEPQPYDGRVTLFRAGTLPAEETEEAEDSDIEWDELVPGDIDVAADPTLGWSALAADGVALEPMPGNHYTLVRPPHVRMLATRLNACIEAAQIGPADCADQLVTAAPLLTP